jgi:hypothetical protein
VKTFTTGQDCTAPQTKSGSRFSRRAARDCSATAIAGKEMIRPDFSPATAKHHLIGRPTAMENRNFHIENPKLHSIVRLTAMETFIFHIENSKSHLILRPTAMEILTNHSIGRPTDTENRNFPIENP